MSVLLLVVVVVPVADGVAGAEGFSVLDVLPVHDADHAAGAEAAVQVRTRICRIKEIMN